MDITYVVDVQSMVPFIAADAVFLILRLKFNQRFWPYLPYLHHVPIVTQTSLVLML